MKYLFVILFVASGFFANAQTNFRTVMVDTSGVIQRPTNFITTNKIVSVDSNGIVLNPTNFFSLNGIVDVNNPSFGKTIATEFSTNNGGIAFVFGGIGTRVQTGNETNGRACASLGDSFWTFRSFSGGPMPANKAIDFYLHGVTLSVFANTNWISRIVFGAGTSGRVPPMAGEDAISSRGWGIEFYWNGTNQVWRPFWFDSQYNVGPEVVLTNSGSVYNRAMKLSQNGNGLISFTINNNIGLSIPSTPNYTNVVTFGANSYGGNGILLETSVRTNTAVTGSGAGFLTREQYLRYVP